MGDHVCPWWLAYTFDNPLRRLLHDPEELLAPYVTRGMTVVDAGCGMGFTAIGLARLVGDEGAVLAVDVQQEMLDITRARAGKAGVSSRIRLRRCAPDDLGVTERAGFILAFWMVHEVPDARAFFRQAGACLAPGGKVLVAEPRIHVSSRQFEAIVRSAREAGLVPRGSPAIRFSRSVLLEPARAQHPPGPAPASA